MPFETFMNISHGGVPGTDAYGMTKRFRKERFHSHNLLSVAAVRILCVAADKCADRFERGKPATPDGKTIIRGIHLWSIGIRSRQKIAGSLAPGETCRSYAV